MLFRSSYLTKTGKAGKVADVTTQHKLNKAFFGQDETPSMFERFMKSSPEERKEMESESTTWLTLKIKAIQSNNQIPKGIFPKRQKFAPGGMYSFVYDAKTKKDLPIWDKYPLIVLLKMESDGFLGLNLHYLDIETRTLFLSKIMGSSYRRYNEKTDELYLAISYDVLKGNKSLSDYKICIKKYLTNQVRSKILPIEPHEWVFASTLNIAGWQRK